MLSFSEAKARLGQIYPGNDEKRLAYALQVLDEQVKRVRDFRKTSQERWFKIGNSFKVVGSYIQWLEKQRARGYSLGSLAEDFSMQSSLFDRFLKETGTDLY